MDAHNGLARREREFGENRWKFSWRILTLARRAEVCNVDVLGQESRMVDGSKVDGVDEVEADAEAEAEAEQGGSRGRCRGRLGWRQKQKQRQKQSRDCHTDAATWAGAPVAPVARPMQALHVARSRVAQ